MNVEATAADIHEAGGTTTALTCDVRDEAADDAMVSDCVEAFGCLPLPGSRGIRRNQERR